MAILIRSSNIYHSTNDKIINNEIKTVKLPIWRCFSEKKENNSVNITEKNTSGLWINNDIVYDNQSFVKGQYYVAQFEDSLGITQACGGMKVIFLDVNYEIPLKNGALIITDAPNSYTITKKIQKYSGIADAEFAVYDPDAVFNRSFYLNKVYYSNNTIPIFIKQDDKFPTVINVDLVYDNVNYQAYYDPQLTDDIKITLSSDKCIVSGRIVCGTVLFYGMLVPQNGFNGMENSYTFKGWTVDEYRPQSITIELFGESMVLEFKENLIVKSNGYSNGREVALNSNKLVQYISFGDGFEYPEADYPHQLNAKNVLDSFSKGKETATLLCSISDYYDEKGNKIISTQTSNKMTFNLYDEVVPLVYKSPSVDMPMSVNNKFEPKKFVVLGSEIFYDGSVWQQLQLQESGIAEGVIFTDGTKGLSLAASDSIGEVVCDGIGTATDSHIIIPSIMYGTNGGIVVGVSNLAFNLSPIITSLTIRSSGYIGNSAFSGCTSLTSVTIGNGVTSIGISAFSNCSGLTSVVIGDGVDTIESLAFFNCTQLRNITIPKNVKYIESSVFNRCQGLNSVEFKGTPFMQPDVFKTCIKLTDIFVPWSMGEVDGAPWGATNATIHYNYQGN